MKAISIRQPYAHNIIFDGKDVENRDWRTHYRGPVLIHASKSTAELDKDERGQYQFGGIVGMAEIVDCVQEMESRWFFGPWGFVLENVKELPFMPCKGALSFFTPDISAQVAALWHDGTLSEGQGSNILSVDRVHFREICDTHPPTNETTPAMASR
ncbi:MAG: hypothetical protein KAI73_05125 [Rhodospirillaceae bacterium]|nr:hypothetical protein [Rhodospirillaceae bacterium]